MNKLFKKTLVRICGLSLLALVAVCINCSCSNESHATPVSNEINTNRTKKSVFIYKDVNGVFHANHHCYILLMNEAREGGNYAVKFFPKRWAGDWYDFANDNYLCIHCFDEDVLNELNKQSEKREIIRQ